MGIEEFSCRFRRSCLCLFVGGGNAVELAQECVKSLGSWWIIKEIVDPDFESM